MKTPREVLFAKHRQADAKLDAIRQEVVTAVCDRCRSQPTESSAVTDRRYSLREFLLSLRWHLAGMSAVWLAVVLLNVDSSPNPTVDIAKRDIPTPRQLLASLREYRRQLWLLVEPMANEPVSLPPRRSYLQPPTEIV